MNIRWGSNLEDWRKNWFTREKVWIFFKANAKFCLSLRFNADNDYFLGNGKEIFKLKADNKNVNFLTWFCLGSRSNGFGAIESRKVFLNGNVCDFSVGYNFVDKSNISIIYNN